MVDSHETHVPYSIKFNGSIPPNGVPALLHTVGELGLVHGIEISFIGLPPGYTEVTKRDFIEKSNNPKTGNLAWNNLRKTSGKSSEFPIVFGKKDDEDSFIGDIAETLRCVSEAPLQGPGSKEAVKILELLGNDE